MHSQTTFAMPPDISKASITYDLTTRGRPHVVFLEYAFVGRDIIRNHPMTGVPHKTSENSRCVTQAYGER